MNDEDMKNLACKTIEEILSLNGAELQLTSLAFSQRRFDPKFPDTRLTDKSLSIFSYVASLTLVAKKARRREPNTKVSPIKRDLLMRHEHISLIIRARRKSTGRDQSESRGRVWENTRRGRSASNHDDLQFAKDNCRLSIGREHDSKPSGGQPRKLVPSELRDPRSSRNFFILFSFHDLQGPVSSFFISTLFVSLLLCKCVCVCVVHKF